MWRHGEYASDHGTNGYPGAWAWYAFFISLIATVASGTVLAYFSTRSPKGSS